jgi:hypothetical protein
MARDNPQLSMMFLHVSVRGNLSLFDLRIFVNPLLTPLADWLRLPENPAFPSMVLRRRPWNFRGFVRTLEILRHFDRSSAGRITERDPAFEFFMTI